MTSRDAKIVVHVLGAHPPHGPRRPQKGNGPVDAQRGDEELEGLAILYFSCDQTKLTRGLLSDLTPKQVTAEVSEFSLDPVFKYNPNHLLLSFMDDIEIEKRES